jgi:hypothetical protein
MFKNLFKKTEPEIIEDREMVEKLNYIKLFFDMSPSNSSHYYYNKLIMIYQIITINNREYIFTVNKYQHNYSNLSGDQIKEISRQLFGFNSNFNPRTIAQHVKKDNQLNKRINNSTYDSWKLQNKNYDENELLKIIEDKLKELTPIFKSFDKIYNRTYDLKKEYNSEENIEFYKYKYGEKEDIIKEINYIYDKIDKHEKNNENFINFITEDYNDIPVPTTARVVNLQQAIPVNGGGKKNKKVTKKSMRKKQRKKITNKRYNSKKLKRNKIVKTRKHRN